MIGSPPDAEKITEAENALKEANNLLTLAQEQEKTAIENVEKGVEPEVSYRPSISRYIALITSIITIILVVCMSSFFIYQYIRTGCPPDFSALTPVLIALGLGVTPT